MPTDSPIWADVRHAFEHSPETVAVIARRHGVTRCQITYRAKACGWTPRPSGAESLRIANFKRSLGLKPPSLAEPLPPSPIPERSQLEHKAAGGFGSRSHRAALIKRFYEIVDLKLAEVERRLKSDATLTPPEAERETREIGTLIKNFEKLTELTDAHASSSARRTASTDIGTDDAERLREDLVQRLERIRLARRHQPADHGDEDDAARDAVPPA